MNTSSQTDDNVNLNVSASFEPIDIAHLESLRNATHADPHRLLGRHGDQVILWNRAAQKASVIDLYARSARASTFEIECERFDDLFIAQVPSDLSSYRVKWTFADGTCIEAGDPYRFLPTIGELDLHLISEGTHHRLWDVLGGHEMTVDGDSGTRFAVWAPNARSVSVVGDFNYWQDGQLPMRSLGGSGVWELFCPGLKSGDTYKFSIKTNDGRQFHKADPMAKFAETAPSTASKIWRSDYVWGDEVWHENRARSHSRASQQSFSQPISIYELHAGSWKHVVDENGSRPMNYRELAESLPTYVKDMGFTHVEFLPLAEHPYAPSWGYQVTSYFAPASRLGSPDDLKYLIDELHRAQIGVLVDWVPAHFPKDDWALAQFDGTSLYEHSDPKLGAHPDWGTLVFNYGRNEVRNFLIANALYWLEEYHVDGLRVDAVASMLYLDYSRKEGEWIPNKYGGRENLEAIDFLKKLSEVVHAINPDVLLIAEESTAWPGVSRPTYAGGLGFGLKWNMGWMHDTLKYVSRDPIYRRFHHDDLTFGLLYAWHENFVLPLSHDEVVHGKGSLLSKTTGDRWQQMANLRALYAWMWAHPGKKLLFAGGEIAQENEWNFENSVDWHVLQWDQHRGVQQLVCDLNTVYKHNPPLWECDFDERGFYWIEPNDASANVFAFARRSPSTNRTLICIANFSPVPRKDHRIGVPFGGLWNEVLNTDSIAYGGSNVGNDGKRIADNFGSNGQSHSILVNIGPLAVLWFEGGE